MLLQTATTELPGGYGWALLQAILALIGVCLLAWVILRWLSRVGVGQRPEGSFLQIVDRLPLDARRSLYLIRSGERVLLVGVGDGDAPRLITELDASEAKSISEPPPSRSFSDVLKHFRSTSEEQEQPSLSAADG